MSRANFAIRTRAAKYTMVNEIMGPEIHNWRSAASHGAVTTRLQKRGIGRIPETLPETACQIVEPVYFDVNSNSMRYLRLTKSTSRQRVGFKIRSSGRQRASAFKTSEAFQLDGTEGAGLRVQPLCYRSFRRDQLVKPNEAEKLGYPTQKPVGLLRTYYRRLIQSRRCRPRPVLRLRHGGRCGAEARARQWIGIDITHLAVGLDREAAARGLWRRRAVRDHRRAQGP